MATEKAYSDFVLTGCAIVPIMALSFGRPEIALFSHIVLLVAGLLVAGMEDDAPFKQSKACLLECTEPSVQDSLRQLPGPRNMRLLAPRHQRPPMDP